MWQNFNRQQTPLTGYGVELRLKSTEYKAQDDSQKKENDQDDDIEKAAGFNFKVLKVFLYSNV